MSLIVFSLVGSAILLALIAVGLRRGGGAPVVVLIAVAGTFLFMCVMSVAVALQSLLTVVVATACWICRARPRTVFLGSLAAMAASYAFVLWTSIPDVRRRAELRETYPLESLSERLAYETRRPADQASDPAPVKLAAEVQTHLNAFEAQRTMSYRARQLEALHDRTRDAFVLARGFGPVRMIGLTPGNVELPPLEPIPLPSADEEYSPDAQPRGPLADVSRPPSVARGELFRMHERSTIDLLDVNRMGYVRDRDHVAGFQSHAFSRLPSPGGPDCSGAEPSPWQVARLELVGLLSHETPLAYVSQELPRMDELREAPTRPLNAFELASLEKLRRDEDVVIQEDDRRIQMVGSLRAAQDCLECHSARRGELLGALSYELVPKRAAPPPAEPGRQIDPRVSLEFLPAIADAR